MIILLSKYNEFSDNDVIIYIIEFKSYYLSIYYYFDRISLESNIIVKGPSFMRETFISAPNSPE